MLRIGSKSNKRRNKKRHHFRAASKQAEKFERKGGGSDMALGAIMQAGVSRSLTAQGKTSALEWG